MARARAAAKEDTKRRLIAAARAVFAREGYHGATLARIAGEAGVTTGAIYASFGGKGELFLAAQEDWGTERLADLMTLLKKRGDLDLTTVAKHWVSRHLSEREWQIVMLEFRLHAARNPELNKAYREQNRLFLALAQGLSFGSRDLALALTMLSNGWLLERLTDPGEVPEKQYLELLQLVGNAVGQ